MRCRDDACPCLEHVTFATHVPVCTRHSVPLHPSEREPGKGYCPACVAAGRHAHYPPWTWGWLHRDTFAGDDLPPWNGFVDLTDRLEEEAR